MSIQAIDDGNFDKLVQAGELPQVVFFWAPWSKPCGSASEALNELSKTYDGRLKIFCMNVDENANIPASLGVRVVPQVSLVRDGLLIRSLEGRQPKVKIREFLERILGEASPG